MKTDKTKIEMANRAYFQSLVYSRASLHSLPIFSWLALFFLGLETVGMCGYYKSYGFESFSIWAVIYSFLTIVMLLISVVSLNTKLVYTHQIFFSWIFTATVFISTVWLTTISYLMIANNSQDERVYLAIGVIFLPIACSIFIIYLIINCIVLNIRLKYGVFSTRTQRNFQYFSKSWLYRILIVAAMIAFVRIILAGSMPMVIGISIALIFLVSFPSVLVEFAYLAYLKGKDKQYWEAVAERPKRTSEEAKKFILKITKWFYIVASFVFIVVVGNIYGDNIPTAISVINLIIILSWIIFVVVWLMKKIKRGRKQ